MSEEGYLFTAAVALATITAAMAEAQCLLPVDVVAQRWIASHYSPAAWRSVESWYLARVDADAGVSAILTDMVLLSQAVACLTTITKGRVEPERKPDLQLAKMKRVS